MVEDSKLNPEIEIKIESELFALVKSILNLNSKFQKGKINETFFRKALKNTMNNLFKLKISINENNLLLADLLEKMSLSKEYNEIIDLINRITSLNFSNEKTTIKKKQSPSFLELPGLTSEITSSFITLMDALTLNDIQKEDFLTKLFDELITGLNSFPGLENLLFKVESTQRKVLHDIDKIRNESGFRKQVIDDLYSNFKEFQTKLDLNH
uniref:Putative Vps28-like protein n=1 Tax=uncultured organism TaxID=155900 RepID=A0A0F6PX65_9ZZZZ|nr:putative Vps28-like protein [uncultured organism]